MKARVNILIERETLQTAHELGINISKVCENALRKYIQALRNVSLLKQGETFLDEASFGKEGSVDRAGFEPAASALRRRRSYQTDLPAREVSLGKEPSEENML